MLYLIINPYNIKVQRKQVIVNLVGLYDHKINGQVFITSSGVM